MNNQIKSVLITGNLGYIGSVLVPMLNTMNIKTIGYDTNLFDDACQLYPSQGPVKQIIKDIRDIEKVDLHNVDAIIHLASLSNDPLGEFNPDITHEINYKATVRIAAIAKECNVKRFVYASSQSMYGIANTDIELDEDESEKNPITAYAKTKWMAECELKQLGSDKFIVSFFRPSTVFGASPKLRCDIVFNNLVACAYTTGKIEIKSDGTPWRPVVHIKDVSNAFIAGLTAPEELVANQAFNVGIPNGNFTVRELASAAQLAVKESTLTFTNEHGKDARTYKVSFEKILSNLKDFFTPKWNLNDGGSELVNMFKKVKFNENDFRGDKTNRLLRLKTLLSNKTLNSKLKRTAKK